VSKNSPTLRDWLKAARLRTLPLAFSCILTGAAMVLSNDPERFSGLILGMTLLTTLCLQVLSNWANDYGDYLRGTDDDSRIGPQRALQSGSISALQMKKAIIGMALVSFVTGIALLAVSGVLWSLSGVTFICLGLLAIWAAIRYTAGNKPYGYAGYGDFAVFMFFGILGVLGSSFLHNLKLPSSMDVLPASAIGFLSTAVLNLNNMRDALDDRRKGKITMAVRLGTHTAKIYHALLISLGLLSMMIYQVVNYTRPLDMLFLLIAPILIAHLIIVFKNKEASKLDPELKKVALSTFLLSILFLISSLF
jgi:1,4-dihydroxy-2-naphthoate octaprenyltransferase